MVIVYFLVIILIVACCLDYRHHKIPNWLIIIGMAAGAFWQICNNSFMGLVFWIFYFLCMILLTYPLFFIGTLGAGDVKLFGVVGGFFAGKESFAFLFCSFLCGAVFALVKMLYVGNGRQRIIQFYCYLLRILQSRTLEIYEDSEHTQTEFNHSKIHLAGPILFSVLLHIGGGLY